MYVPIGIVGLLISLVYRDEQFRETFRYTIQGVALFPLFIAAIRYHDHRIFKILNVNWIRFLGTLSYSLYLVHFIALSGLSQLTNLHPLMQGSLALLVSIAVATVMYHAVEKPCARLRKRLSQTAA
jgi:peptidoglycan/LPS O-acetylase OafA/YrhL